jgi:hypothetical protein
MARPQFERGIEVAVRRADHGLRPDSSLN